MTSAPIDAYLAVFRAAGALKDTLRSGRTAGGRHESVADHSWRLCLMAVVLEEDLDGLDPARLLRLLILHDLGEALRGDVPAPMQTGDKAAGERADLAALLAPLPGAMRARLLAIWDEYDAAATPEARFARGLDKLETVLHHVEGANGPDFDYGFNLGYGRDRTDVDPLLAALRAPVDAETARLAGTASTRTP